MIWKIIWFFDQIIKSDLRSDQIMISKFVEKDPRSHHDLIFDCDLIFFQSDHPSSAKLYMQSIRNEIEMSRLFLLVFLTGKELLLF